MKSIKGIKAAIAANLIALTLLLATNGAAMATANRDLRLTSYQTPGCNVAMPVEEGGSTPSIVGPLIVPAGSNQICDSGNGNALVVLRGLVRNGMELLGNGEQAINAPITKSEIDAMHAWGANFMRVPLSAEFVDQALLGQGCPLDTYDPQYASDISDVVSSATQDHLFVLLDVHFTNPNCFWNNSTTALASGGSGWSGGNTMAMPGYDVSNALAALARLYGANPLVGFELYNEPHVCQTLLGPQSSYQNANCSVSEQSNSAIWANGGSISDGVNYSAPGMNELYQQVRQYSSSLVFINGNNYATDAGSFASLSNSAGAVYILHYYPCVSGCSAVAAECSSVQQIIGGELASGDLEGHPVIYDEFGWPQHQKNIKDGTELSYVVSYLESHGLGWAAFAWDGHSDATGSSPWQLVANSGINGYVPNGDGVPIQNALLGNAATTCS